MPLDDVAAPRGIGDTRRMARGALTGSLVVHAIALAAIAGLAARRASHPTSRSAGPPNGSPIAIELTAPPAASRMPTPENRMPAPTTASGVPTAASRVPAPTAARSAQSGRVETTLQIEPTGGGAAEATGASGGGRGVGVGGNGIGFGAGGGIASPVDTAHIATPEPPKPSLARPPRLIWPARQVAIGDRPLFVAHVTVDRDGFVAGAQLVQGTGDQRDLGAADAVWRFRYDPALDEDGRPIAAAIDQPVLLR